MPELERQKRRSDWRTYTMVLVIVIIHVAAAYVIVSFYFGYTGMLSHMNDFNAMHATHDAIRMHIERTGVWPNSWKDLKADLRELNVEDVEWIRERVEVDFSLTSEDLQAHPDAQIIRLRSGWETPELPELNRLLRESLR